MSCGATMTPAESTISLFRERQQRRRHHAQGVLRVLQCIVALSPGSLDAADAAATCDLAFGSPCCVEHVKLLLPIVARLAQHSQLPCVRSEWDSQICRAVWRSPLLASSPFLSSSSSSPCETGERGGGTSATTFTAPLPCLAHFAFWMFKCGFLSPEAAGLLPQPPQPPRPPVVCRSPLRCCSCNCGCSCCRCNCACSCGAKSSGSRKKTGQDQPLSVKSAPDDFFSSMEAACSHFDSSAFVSNTVLPSPPQTPLDPANTNTNTTAPSVHFINSFRQDMWSQHLQQIQNSAFPQVPPSPGSPPHTPQLRPPPPSLPAITTQVPPQPLPPQPLPPQILVPRQTNAQPLQLQQQQLQQQLQAHVLHVPKSNPTPPQPARPQQPQAQPPPNQQLWHGVKYDPLFGQSTQVTQIEVVKVFNSHARPSLMEIKFNGAPPKRFILKKGDDLRVDMMVQVMFGIFNVIWESSSMQLKPRAFTYIVTPMNETIGAIEFVENAVPLTKFNWHSIDPRSQTQIDELLSSATGGYVAAYILGVRDRHQDNMMFVNTTSTFFHIDFGYIFNTKPWIDANRFAFPVELREKLETAGAWERFLGLCEEAFTILRRCSSLITYLCCLLFDKKPMQEHLSVNY
ncbi:Phosphatidylinositol 3-kinase 1 [Pelomyxa schiedti]|nr:Phosphatidylinositol 3-kinase 1 [Pelomyxa schiedti]